MTTWIADNNGNRCSVERWGSEAAAQAALDSLKNCSDCSDCSYCSRCSGCSGCSGCSYCSRCSRCSGCSGCSGLNKSNSAPEIPKIANIHQSVYAAASQPGALEMADWHTCEKTHCRAGWVVALAGSRGKELEATFNTELAAMMIYDASSSLEPISPARFYDDNESALADMKRLAELEAES